MEPSLVSPWYSHNVPHTENPAFEPATRTHTHTEGHTRPRPSAAFFQVSANATFNASALTTEQINENAIREKSVPESGVLLLQSERMSPSQNVITLQKHQY